MNNLKYAKIVLGVSAVIAASIPISVLLDQKKSSANRKKNILVDRERMRQKLEKNPNLKMKTELEILPIKPENNDFILSPHIDHRSHK
ncbi:unnamed protein product [Blepharisma stoltei]|uniref:Uncharacterized protein n=1 Tax=Blepharisma stoltei TaxID=1481888 RepID=A0AAU9JTZ7_9CILI|nr:unnamed protein product [Blepharisma stoltei]